MKKIMIALLSIMLIFSACGSLRVADVNNLRIGMSQYEVERIMGKPVRILASSRTQDGLFEAFEYRTYRNEAYAIEFWDGELNRYEFLYDDIPASGIAPAPVYPVYPTNPRPVRPVRPPNNKPGRPNDKPDYRPGKPDKPGRPNDRPDKDRPNYQPGRPGDNGGRPSQPNKPSDKPGKPSEPTKPADKPARPSDRPRPSVNQPESVRPATRPDNGGPSSVRPSENTAGRRSAEEKK